jgi:uncharacterized protein (TIGR02466 family)
MNVTIGNFQKKTYFPTQIFQVDLDEPDALNAHLLDAIYREQERDLKGISRSNFTELGGWHSQNDLHKNPDYADLVAAIGNATERISTDLGYNPKYHITIGTMWSIINPPGSSNRAHVHPGCLWSGVYYIHAAKNAGNIEFIEPRTAHLMNQPSYAANSKRPKECWTKVRFEPVPGRMIIFPSWLYHAVDPNMSKEKDRAGHRVIISFNLNQTRRPAAR